MEGVEEAEDKAGGKGSDKEHELLCSHFHQASFAATKQHSFFSDYFFKNCY